MSEIFPNNIQTISKPFPSHAQNVSKSCPYHVQACPTYFPPHAVLSIFLLHISLNKSARAQQHTQKPTQSPHKTRTYNTKMDKTLWGECLYCIFQQKHSPHTVLSIFLLPQSPTQDKNLQHENG